MNTKTKLAGVVLLLLALILVNYLASAFPARLDLTADRLYTLSPGTRNLLSKIEEPVTLELYFSRSSEGLPILFKNYATRVEHMLRQYVAASRGSVRLNIVDPRPDTQEEEAALRAGLSSQPLPTGDTLFFGLVAYQADQQRTIAFFSPNREPFLEYDISQLIYTTQLVDKPTLGIITSLPLRGAPFTMPGQPSEPGQVSAEEWERAFHIEEINPVSDVIPDSVDILAVIHPQELSEELEYAIDQFLLSGRTVFIAVDPSSRHFRNQGGQMAMFGGPTPNVSSDLPRLFSAWGISYDRSEVIGDANLATQVSMGRGGAVAFPVWLSLLREHFNEDFQPVTGLNSLLLVEAGALEFDADGNPEVEVSAALQSTPAAGRLAAMTIDASPPEQLMREIAPEGARQAFALLLRGNFAGGFPDGPPVGGEEAGDETSSGASIPHLAASSAPGTLFVIADTDWLLDAYSVRRMNFMGMTALEPLNDNLAFSNNIFEYLSGSDDLISIRGKGSSLRPFTVVRRMEQAAQARYQEALDALERELQGVQARLSELLEHQREAGSLVATPEMQEQIDRFRADEARMRSERREIRKALREDIERLETVLLLVNLLTVPGLIAIGGVWFFSRRHRRQNA